MPVPTCPRCGYDQTGAIAAWDREQSPQCPTSGTCSECGLAFAWRDLLNPVHGRQDRNFEHARRDMARAFLRTFWAALRPWALWRSVRMEHVIVWSRLAPFATAGFVLVATPAALALTRCGWLYNEAETLMNKPYTPIIDWSDFFVFGQLATWPPDSWNYRTGWSWKNPYGIPAAPWCAVGLLAFCLMPAAFLLLPITFRRARVRRRHLFRVGAYAAVSLPLALAAPVFLATLAGIAVNAAAAAQGKRFWLEGLGVWWDHHRWVPGLVCVGLWMGLWWTLAAGRYLRLPHAPAIGAAMTVLAILLAIGLIAAVPGGATWLVWGL